MADLSTALQGIGAAFQGQAPQFLQQQQQRQQMERAQMLQNEDLAEKRRMTLFKDAAMMRANPEMAGSILQDRLAQIQRFNDMGVPVDPKHTQEMIQLYQSGDMNAFSRYLDNVIRSGQSIGAIAQPAAPTIGKYGDVIINKDGTQTVIGMQEGQEFIDPETKSMMLRKIAEQAQGLNKGIDEVTTAFNKVVGLEKEMRAGNRGAINAGIMNVARLISPGVVTDRDAAQLSGANTSIGLMYEFLQGQGVDMEALLKVYDPSNPETFNVDALMATAKNVTAAAIPSIMSGYSDLESTATNFQAPSAMMRSFFDPESRRMKSLKKIQDLVSGNQEPSTAPMSQEEIYARAAAGTLPPGDYSIPDPENPGQMLILNYAGQ